MSDEAGILLTLEMIRRARRALEEQPFPTPTAEEYKVVAGYFESQYFRAWLLCSTTRFEVAK